jgi:hypothetical protein
MPERSPERRIHIHMDEDLHKRLRIRCAELDTTIQDCVVALLERERSDTASRRGAKSHALRGRR